MLYIVYLDEFGHIGPYISHNDPKHKTHPIFGLGGFVLPSDQVRNFSTFFFKLKQQLFGKFDIPQAEKKAREKGDTFHIARWEKKGSQLYSANNVNKYRQLRTATNRLLNTIEKSGGFTFYVGEAKKKGNEHNSQQTYYSCLKEVIKRLNLEFERTNDQFIIILDEHQDRAKIVENASITMFADGRYNLIEAPFQVESHLYQTIQCADWLCAILGKLSFYDCEPESKPDYSCFQKYFEDRIKKSQKRSNIRNNFKGASKIKLEALQNKFNGQ